MSSSAYDIATQLSDLVETTLKEGPQVVAKDGVETAVLVSIEDWRRLKGVTHLSPSSPRRTIQDILLDPNGPRELDIPLRGRLRLRPPFEFE